MKFRLNVAKPRLDLQPTSSYDEMVLVNLMRLLVKGGHITITPNEHPSFNSTFTGDASYTSKKRKKLVEDFIS